jgi:ABC-type bacteriocin/lantibiotic exporter with double-glycine peptidase domain
MPLLAHHDQMGWLVLRGLNAQQEWVVEVLNPDKGGFEEKALHDLQGLRMAKLSLAVPFESSNSPVYQLVKRELLSHKRVLAEAALAGLVLNLIALAVSFYSMQVYDRVVPTGASQTLMVLTLGVLVAAVFEVTIKHLRSHLYAHLIDNVDQRLSRAVYMRFLSNPASGMVSGSALSTSHEPPGRNGASHSSQARLRAISPSKLPTASRRVHSTDAVWSGCVGVGAFMQWGALAQSKQAKDGPVA